MLKIYFTLKEVKQQIHNPYTSLLFGTVYPNYTRIISKRLSIEAARKKETPYFNEHRISCTVLCKASVESTSLRLPMLISISIILFQNTLYILYYSRNLICIFDNSRLRLNISQ